MRMLRQISINTMKDMKWNEEIRLKIGSSFWWKNWGKSIKIVWSQVKENG